jgi:hypothetical protein
MPPLAGRELLLVPLVKVVSLFTKKSLKKLADNILKMTFFDRRALCGESSRVSHNCS